ncbi:MAG TPA: cupredoxin domain-containing protein [Gemmatimonadales bacterium]|jgi:plastocyanin|nr:cupredoxin domain-containing protein [Gemmatimonadales bacterium]
MRFVRTAVVALFVAAFVAACSSNSTGSSSGGHTTALTVSNNSFNPTPDTVPAGQVTFSWVNASNSHNVTWLTGPGTLPANSSTMTSGTFNATLAPGTYTYHCTIHAGMGGTIVVQ